MCVCVCVFVRQIKECLFDPEILECFKAAVNRAKKSCGGIGGKNAEAKTATDEFDAYVTSVFSGSDAENSPPLLDTAAAAGVADAAMSNADSSFSQLPSDAKPKRGKAKVVTADKAKKGKKPAAQSKKKRVLADSSDESDGGADDACDADQDGSELDPQPKATVLSKRQENLPSKSSASRGQRVIR